MNVMLLVTAFLLSVTGDARLQDAGTQNQKSPTMPDAAVEQQDMASPVPIAPLRKSAARADVEIRHMHMVVDRKGDRVEVSQVFTLGGLNNVRFESKDGYPIPLPAGALAPRVLNEHGEHLACKIRDGEFVVTEAILPGGGDVAVSFEIPIKGKSALITQKLMGNVGVGQIVLTWTRGKTKIDSPGLGEAKLTTLQNGLHVLVAMGQNVPGNPFTLRITGLVTGGEALTRYVTLILCVLLFAVGFAFWVRGRKRGSSAQ